MVSPKKNILVSLAIASLIFIGGLGLGVGIDNLRSKEVLKNLQRNELETESYLLQERLLRDFKQNACEILSTRINKMKYATVEIGQQLGEYSKKRVSYEKDFDYLKRKYFILEVQFMMLIQDLQKHCDEDIVYILFFYTIDNQESIKQGYVLTNLEKEYEDNLIVLSIDKDYHDEPLVDTLKQGYNITHPTTVVVNDEVIKEGFIGSAELKKQIERKFKAE
ncbi:hypothetical protein J4430_04030 [Candidatus Woesearchaeota archaeon]|nr:hypothetical protein [Candidatus Woesearchaeota archaeon]